MTEVARLVLAVDSTQADRATRSLDGLDKAAGRNERAAHKLGKAWGVAAGLIGSAVVIGGIRSIVSATIEQERVTAQLEARLRSTGGAAGLTKKELLDMASGLQAVTTYGDEAIIGAQSLMLTFTRIGRDVFPKALESVLDMSTALGQDLQSSALMVGKALNDPIQGVTALTRAGVQFTADQKKVIKELVETGRSAEAQKIILRELETQMGGSARAARDTLGGALAGLKNAFGDLLEGDSGGDGVRGATAAINDLTALMSSQDTKDAFGAVVQGLFSVASAAVTATQKIAQLIGKYSEFLEKRGLAPGDSPEALQARRDRLLASLQYTGGPRGLFAQLNRDRIMEEVREIDQKLAEQREGIDFTRGAPGPNLFAPTGEEDSATGGKGKKARAAKLTEEERALERLNRAHESLTQQMEREIFLNGEATRAANVRYETTLGALRDLEEGQKKALIATAEHLDFMEEVYAHEEAVTDRATKTFKDRTDAMTEFSRQAARNIQDAFGNFFFDPFGEGTDNMARRFGDALRRMGAELASSQLLKMLGQALSGSTATGGWGDFLRGIGGAMSAQGGGRAGGGPVMAGSSYWVGDGGERELFTPNQSGRITPESQMGGGRPLQVKLEVINNGAPVEAQTTQRTGADGSQLIRLVLGAVGDSIATGQGPTYAAMKGRFGLRDAV